MELLKSKKFWMAVVGVIAIVLAQFLPITEDQVLGIAGVIISYILGQGIADSGKSVAKLNEK